jgi:malate synthase
MQNYIQRGRMQVASILDQFINSRALPNSQVVETDFWQGFESILAEFIPVNEQLLATREKLQQQIDDYHRAGKPATGPAYKQFLLDIGYLEPQPSDFTIDTQHVDDEVAVMAGPQLVVPINNARYALNAANARWGSLYDALYGTDVISEEGGADIGTTYNPVRGAKVVATARQWLDTMLPLTNASHHDSKGYRISDDGQLEVHFASGSSTLADKTQWLGYQGTSSQPTALLFVHNGLHFEIQLDHDHPIGKTDPAGIKDVLLEAALTTIMDCEDSVAAVDAEDKTLVYRNWLGLMQGDLCLEMSKGGKTHTRKMNFKLSVI